MYHPNFLYLRKIKKHSIMPFRLYEEILILDSHIIISHPYIIVNILKIRKAYSFHKYQCLFFYKNKMLSFIKIK